MILKKARNLYHFSIGFLLGIILIKTISNALFPTQFAATNPNVLAIILYYATNIFTLYIAYTIYRLSKEMQKQARKEIELHKGEHIFNAAMFWIFFLLMNFVWLSAAFLTIALSHDIIWNDSESFGFSKTGLILFIWGFYYAVNTRLLEPFILDVHNSRQIKLEIYHNNKKFQKPTL